MATQAVSAEQLVIQIDSDLLARLKDAAAKFGYESSNQVGAEVIERYLESWLASKEAGAGNGAAPPVTAVPNNQPHQDQDNWTGWSAMYERGIAEMMADPSLTDAEKQQILREVELPDDEWEPTVLPEGAEPLSVTIIKMRRGE